MLSGAFSAFDWTCYAERFLRERFSLCFCTVMLFFLLLPVGAYLSEFSFRRALGRRSPLGDFLPAVCPCGFSVCLDPLHGCIQPRLLLCFEMLLPWRFFAVPAAVQSCRSPPCGCFFIGLFTAPAIALEAAAVGTFFAVRMFALRIGCEFLTPAADSRGILFSSISELCLSCVKKYIIKRCLRDYLLSRAAIAVSVTWILAFADRSSARFVRALWTAAISFSAVTLPASSAAVSLSVKNSGGADTSFYMPEGRALAAEISVSSSDSSSRLSDSDMACAVKSRARAAAVDDCVEL
jgi:hypothetical protein